ncbi:LysR family transcriptional regulator [Thalassotalea sp. PLHSN55]|uniref:LysR family transcriptional regulator n=1 Tax=Thalassotalea sp. PLHSN55 TaxID=3435888 RepID=UPI003F82A24B
MQIEELQRIVHLAHSQNIQVSANALNITAGALSKTLKKIEHKLHTKLFDRIGRTIKLNSHGKKFIGYALNLIHEYEQMCSEFTDNHVKYQLHLSGPTVLLEASLQRIIPHIPQDKIAMTVDPIYEGDALDKLENGQAHIAIVTDAAIAGESKPELTTISLGSTCSKLIASPEHAIFNAFPEGKVTMNALLTHGFVCPNTSPFCGIARGVGSDGWPDHQFSRKIPFRTDDISSLLSVVKQGAALAYVPDVIIDEAQFRIIELTDVAINNVEAYSLVYRTSTADGWLNQLVTAIKKH